jgi:ribosome biogenesis GTPase
MQGKIIKGIAGFYYVDVVESGIYECKAKGIFRKEKRKPLVGDNVEIEILNEEEKTGNLVQIYERKNELIRPAAANVDQALVIFAVRQPDPNYVLLDRFLIAMEQQEIPVEGGELCIHFWRPIDFEFVLTRAILQKSRNWKRCAGSMKDADITF